MGGLFGDSAAGSSRRTNARTCTMQASYRVTTSIQGLVIPLLYGRNRVSPNIFFVWGWQAIPVYSSEPAAGGKGGAGSRHVLQGYNYTEWTFFGLCEGPVTAIGLYWNDWGCTPWFSNTNLMPGNRPQPMTSLVQPPGGPASQFALAYFGTAFFWQNQMLDDGSMPNFSFECYGLLPTRVPTAVSGEAHTLPGPATASESYATSGSVEQPIVTITVANAALFIADGGVTLQTPGNSPVALTRVSGTPASGQYAETNGVYQIYVGPAAIGPTATISYTYVPAATFKVPVNILQTCSEEYTLPDDNPVTVLYQDIYESDAGVTLDGVPMTRYPFVNIGPGQVETPPQGSYVADGAGSYWFNPSDQSTPGGLVISYTWSTGNAAGFVGPMTVSPSGNAFAADQGAAYAGGAALTRIAAGTPAKGQYLVDALGNYTFSGWDYNATVLLSYTYNQILESNPADFLPDLLTNPYYGAGFDPAKIGDLSQFSAYCLANGFLMSPHLNEQKEAREHVADILKLVNTQVVWSEDRLKFVPMGDQVVTGSLGTFTPDLTPVIDLDEDDLLAEDKDKDPIEITRNPQADAYNQVPLEYLDRYAAYNTSIVTANNQAAQDAYGLRPLDVVQAHAITRPTVAIAAAANILQYCLYARNTYKFKLGLIADILEPGDWITLTSARLGLNQMPLRVVEISQDDKLTSTVTALEWPIGTAQAPAYSSPRPSSPAVNYNASPGDVNPPVILEPPLGLSDAYQVWLAVSGGPNWGGCQIWVSLDGDTYRLAGTVTTPARTGSLLAPLPAGPDPDAADFLEVDLSECQGSLLPASLAECNALATLCYLAGAGGNPPEFIAYENAQLLSSYKYSLSYLRRGCYGYGGAGGTAHSIGERFARLDAAIFQMSYQPNQVGQTIYLKFLSFNQYGGGAQALQDVEPYTYTIQGTALTSPLPDVTALAASYQSGQLYLSWTPITPAQDPRYSQIVYEVRMGASWATGQVMGRVPAPPFLIPQDGTYWVAAAVYGPSGAALAYSATPAEIVVEGVLLPANNLLTVDEAAENWPGTLTNLQNASGALQLAAAQTSGTYTIPAGEIPDLGAAQAAALNASLAFTNIVPGSDFDSAPDVDAIPDVDQYDAGAGGQFDAVPDVDAVPDFDLSAGVLAQTAQIMVQFSQDGSTWGPWQPFTPGTYVFRKVNFQLALSQVVQGNVTQNPVVTDFSWSVSMPDRIIAVGSVACPAGGLAVTFTPAFQTLPSISVTILNAQPGDVVTFPTAIGPSGGVIEIQNGGAGVARNISYIAKGY